MAGKGSGTVAEKLERNISCIKYTLFCLNIVQWFLGATVFGLCCWLGFDEEFTDWVAKLQISSFYYGIYILVFTSIVVMIIAFLGCASALMENTVFLLANIAAQIICFLITLFGAAILRDYSTYDSNIKPIIRRVMLDLITQYPANDYANQVLLLVQEEVGCCGADGPNDYIRLNKPLPSECRDTVTGNAFFHGCVEEMTWYLGDRSVWITGIALTLCLMHVINAVSSLILLQAIKKEEQAYKR